MRRQSWHCMELTGSFSEQTIASGERDVLRSRERGREWEERGRMGGGSWPRGAATLKEGINGVLSVEWRSFVGHIMNDGAQQMRAIQRKSTEHCARP